MDTLSTIRLKIADREYSLRIAPKDEEVLRRASRIINDRIRSKREKMGIKDKQDLLAMVAFDSLVSSIHDEIKDSNIKNRLADLDLKISREMQR